MTIAPQFNLRAIPESVLDFFRLALGQSFIVKGESGTGKTTFALNLLEDLEESGLAMLVGYNSTADVNPGMADVADVHLSLSAKSDAILFRGIHPRTPYYGVYTYEKDGGFRIGFQEIV